MLSYARTQYDAAGRVEATISLDEQADEHITEYGYDTAGRQITVTDANGNTTLTHYLGNRRDYVVDARGTIGGVDPNDYKTSFEYDALGRLIKTTYPATTQNPVTYVHIEYDGLGRKSFESEQTTENNPANAIGKVFEYDAAGRLTAIVLSAVDDPFPESGREAEQVYPRCEYEYDQCGNLLTIKDNVKQYADGTIIAGHARQTSFTYDEMNHQLSRTLPNGSTEYFEYDELGRMTVHIDFEEQATGYFYNARGLLEYKRYYDKDSSPGDGVNENYPLSPAEEFHYTYDVLGRKKEVTLDGQPQEGYFYDNESRVIAVSSPEGYVCYIYNEITGRKIQTRSYAPTDSLDDDVLAFSNNDITRVEYAYDELGRLYETKTIKRDGSLVNPAEVTINTYDQVGNRNGQTKANGIETVYTYDNCNRLTNLVHSSSLSSFAYTLYPDGMRQTVTETLKTSGGSSETHNITYTYDDLNRLTGETADTSPSGNGYTADYTYDITGNRIHREVTANGQTLTTDYQYYADGCDKLEKETHSGPVAYVPAGDKQYYAYAASSRISYRSANGSKVGKVSAFMMGLPNEFAHYLLALVLICIPASFFAPAFLSLRGRAQPRPKQSQMIALWKRCLCVLLAYLMFITPTGFESIAYASSQYSQITAFDWATHKYIEYTYDNNGSCITKTTKNASNETVEDVTYDYNLQNKLERVTKGYTQGSDNIAEVTEYTYNDDGIRVRSYYYKTVNGGANQDEETKTFLIDAYNHTGYAQVLEETDGTNRTTYTIGDDIVTQSTYDGSSATTRHILYDGHGSTRQLTDTTGNLATDQVFSYDGYGVLLGYTGTPQTNLLYCGEYFDSDLKQYNLRARYYDPYSGRFNQLDLYAGNNADPQSLHKYLYCHANPVNGIDPTGKIGEFSLVVSMFVMAMILILFCEPDVANAPGPDAASSSNNGGLIVDTFIAMGVAAGIGVVARFVIDPLKAATSRHIRGLFDRLRFRGSVQVPSINSPITDPSRLLTGSTQLEINKQLGDAFEDSVRASLRTARGTPVLTSQGKVVPDFPAGNVYGVTDAKNVINLSQSAQTRGFEEIARSQNMPFNLIISPRAETVSKPLQKVIKDTGGTIFEFNSATGTFKEITSFSGNKVIR